MKPAKVALFFAHPTVPEYNKLLTMPFVFNILRLLDKEGIDVDLYLSEKNTECYWDYLSENVQLKELNYYEANLLPHRVRHKMMVKGWNSKVSVRSLPSYDLVFGCGPVGTIFAERLSRTQKTPFVYVNDEFPDAYQFSYLKSLEKIAIKNATLIIAPDESRIEPIQKQVEGIEDIPACVLPNAPLQSSAANLPEVDWHQRLNIPAGKKMFLYVGNVLDMNQAPEIFSSLPTWPEEAVLVVKVKSLDPRMTREYGHLIFEDKVFFTSDFLSEEEMNSLFKYSMGSFGLYRDISDNFKFIGKSSGKIMSSLICGAPVIGSRASSLDFVEEHKLGVLVDHPVDIPKAIRTLLAKQDELRTNCQSTVDQWSYEHYWSLFCEKLSQVSDLELDSGD